MIELSRDPILLQPLIDRAAQQSAGAVVAFLGITRRYTEGRETLRLKYEAYEPLARRDLERLEAEARRKWPLVECLIVHRLGETPVSEASVAIVTSSPHRRDAFAASQWLIDSLKLSTPIWKEEHWADGASAWIHPAEGAPPDARP
jgi:molybdopterin synthase catalytic subunit